MLTVRTSTSRNAARIPGSDSTVIVRYLVLPVRPAGTNDCDEDQFAALVTRDAMIGVVPATVADEGSIR